jgi:hypothetical protein
MIRLTYAPAAWGIWVALGLTISGCTKEEHTKEITSQHILNDLYVATLAAAVRTGRQPPTDPVSFFGWVRQFAPEATDWQRFRGSGGAGIPNDAWGNPIRLIVYGGKLVGLGSCGPNGVWEGGKGDDIVLIFDSPEILGWPRRSTAPNTQPGGNQKE